jgi:hypothetical protein
MENELSVAHQSISLMCWIGKDWWAENSLAIEGKDIIFFFNFFYSIKKKKMRILL